MKKILFRKLLLDSLSFFFITLFSASIIIWIFQAVNFLDLIVEDGRGIIVYAKYSIYNFPKILSKIFIFTLFFSFFYTIIKYENNNELIIFWNFGVQKISLFNFIIVFSFLITFMQLILTTFIVPETQNLARSLIRTSNVGFFESFIKPKKFNDNIKNLTIYSDEKNADGILKNIYLKKKTNNKEFQITIAKRGKFKNVGSTKILVLYDGQTINSLNKKITIFTFQKSDLILSKFDANVIVTNKMQETKTYDHIICLKKYLNKDLSLNKNQKDYLNHNCSLNTLDNLFQELYKRIVIPLYTPLLICISLILMLSSKEKKGYNKIKIITFLLGMFFIIFSESTVKFITIDFTSNLKLIILPVFLFIIIYLFFKIKLKKNY
tara:strand:+ start:612 stop:1748 length:1137 start_codon:yes stop_codon:yes gene_type:complete